MSYTPRGMTDRWMFDTMKAVGIGKTLVMMCECRGRMVPVFKPACGPKESKMERKTWEWEGYEMTEYHNEYTGRHMLECKDGVLDCFRIAANSRSELYERALKAGCVEVVKPVPCPMCGAVSDFLRIVCVQANRYAVRCPSDECYAMGPARTSERKAVTAWNDMAAMIARGK